MGRDSQCSSDSGLKVLYSEFPSLSVFSLELLQLVSHLSEKEAKNVFLFSATDNRIYESALLVINVEILGI